MSDTHLETAPHAESLGLGSRRHSFMRRWLMWILSVPLFLWFASVAVSFAIQHSGLRSRLTSGLEAAFGRQVAVENWDFSLWAGPALDAHSITIADDPRFGDEYFLRADSMTIRLRWRSLLRGRLEPGTLSFTRPSLNVVRNAAGEWNLAEWLPRPPGAAGGVRPAVPAPTSGAALRFHRIEVSGGRINFKRSDGKLPVAFVAVNGSLEADGTGSWRIGLEAVPWRAAVLVQQAGRVFVSGHVGGISSRLRPGALDISWTDASLSDVLRLARGDEYGVRGKLALSMNARTQDQGDGWTVQARAELRQIHRWDLALRPDNPSLNLIARTEWRPAASSVELTDLTLESPRSHARVSGRIFWNRTSALRPEESSPVQLRVSSAVVELSDLLAWMRAFHPGVADSLSLHGLVDLRADLSGWPLRVITATMSSGRADVDGAALRRPAHLSAIELHYDRGAIAVLPATLSWGPASGPPDGSFHFDIPAKPALKTFPSWHVVGRADRMSDLVAMAGAFGWSLPRGWDLDGPLRCDLRFDASSESQSAASARWSTFWPAGWIEVGTDGPPGDGASLRAPFLNLPVEKIRARADLKPRARHIALASAQAFGTRWSGSLDRRERDPEWRFALSGDHLSAADLDRWFNPRWRESLLGRVLPFLNARGSTAGAPENLAASGRLSLAQFALAPFNVRNLQGDLKISGRHLELTGATGRFYGGTLAGSWIADLEATPVYHANLEFARVDMPSLIAATPALTGLRAESSAGQLSLDARGATRADLIGSLACQGNVRVAGPELLNFDLWKSLGGEPSATGSTRFPAGSATFSCGGSKIEFQELNLVSGVDRWIEGSGSVDFNRNLDLRFQVQPAPADLALAFRLSGPLASPQVARISPPAQRRSR